MRFTQACPQIPHKASGRACDVLLLMQVADKHIESFTKTRGYSKPNMRFVQGHIEFLDKAGIPDESVDLIISNCVINLSPDKERVLKEAYRVLAPGGEMYFSDVYSSRRLSEEARQDEASPPINICPSLAISLPFIWRSLLPSSQDRLSSIFVSVN